MLFRSKTGWSVTQAEMGYRAKEKTALTPEKKAALENFLESLDDHDDTHRVYAAV